MNSESSSTFLSPGNIVAVHELYRPKVSGGVLSVAHSGVGFVMADGNHVVLHRTPENHTHLSTYEEFSAGQNVTSQKIQSSNLIAIVERANVALKKNTSYGALFNNCEHLAGVVLRGEATSDQLKAVVIGSGLGYLLAHAVNKDMPPLAKVALVAASGALALHIEKRSQLKRDHTDLHSLP